MAQTHEPTQVVAELPENRLLATNEAQDCYFVVHADGSHQRIDNARAAVLYQQRLTGPRATATRLAHRARHIQEVKKEMRAERVQTRRRATRERKRRKEQPPDPDRRTKHIRIADKKRELEEKIASLEAQLAGSEAARADGDPE